MVIIAEFLGCGVTLMMLFQNGDTGGFLAAGLLAGGILLVSLLFWLALGSRVFKQLRPHLQTRIFLALAIALGAALTMMGGHGATIESQAGMLLCIVALGGACVVIVAALAPVQAAMLAFATSGVVALLFTADSLAFSSMALTLLLCLALVSVKLARWDLAAMVRQLEGEAQSVRASRLLAEFEENGTGWFWETDRHGNIAYISAKLAKAIGKTPEAIVGHPLPDLVQTDDADKGERTLGFHMSTRTAFSEIPLRAAIADEERWWSISGRPVIDDYGHFRGFVGSGTDLTEMRRSEAEVTRLARNDPLTGLANRVEMRRTLDQAISDPLGKERRPALFLLDLDRFKSVNDTLGHPVGDQLLKLVAQRLERVVGAQGRVGRLGGDEFKVVLPDLSNREKLSEIARAIIASLSQPYMINGSTVTIGASVGVAVGPFDGATSDALIRNADLALYAAKADGRGVHRFYEAKMHENADERRMLEADLRRALAEGGLHLAYQPVVSTADTRIVGFEALVRWNHPTRGPVSPSTFIPIAEDIGLIEQIGEWVLRTACHEAAGWPRKVRVAVNVSPIQFANPQLATVVANALAASQLDPERLELEITEGVFLNEGVDTDARFDQLKGLGVRLALDDFGTGYSSLGYLKKAPFDKIKIDQSFVRGAAVKGNRNSAIIKAIVALAESLNMETTAEGAETHDEIELIRSLGCSHIQGFIYGKPQPAAETRERLLAEEGEAGTEGFKTSRAPRAMMLRLASLTVDGKSHTVRIRNISAGGALIEGVGDIAEDTPVNIEISEGRTVAAVVRWSAEDRFGLKFNEEINPAQVTAQPQRSQIRRRAFGQAA
ncbi:MAG: EAL domain-containing protein [Sphingomonadaceae bacterium]|nr:EAL domain-containing protein [Sphingomonadaceae bacterium]